MRIEPRKTGLIGRKILDRASKSVTWGALHYTGPTVWSETTRTNQGKVERVGTKTPTELIVGIDVRDRVRDC